MLYIAAISLLLVPALVHASLTGELAGSSLTTEETTNILRALTGETSLTADEATAILRTRAIAMGQSMSAGEAAMQVNTKRSLTSEESLATEQSLTAEAMTNIMRSLTTDQNLVTDESLTVEAMMDNLRALADTHSLTERNVLTGVEMARTTQNKRADAIVKAIEEFANTIEDTTTIVSESKGDDPIDAETRAEDVVKGLNEADTKGTKVQTLVSFAKLSSFDSDGQQAICDAFSDLATSQADFFNKLVSEEARLVAFQLTVGVLENILVRDERIVDGISELAPTCEENVNKSLETVETVATGVIQTIF